MAAWVLLALAPVAAGAMFGFASYYGDHMVLQKEPAGAVVWGYGEPGAAVTVVLSEAGGLVVMKKTARVKGPSGTWTTILDPMDQGGSLRADGRAGLGERDTAGRLLWRRVALQRAEQHGNDGPADRQRQPGAGRRRSLPLRPRLRRSARPLRRGAGRPGANRFAMVHPDGRKPGPREFHLLLGRLLVVGALPLRGSAVPPRAGGGGLGGHPHRGLVLPQSSAGVRAPGGRGELCFPASPPQQQLSGPQTPSVLWNAMIHPLLNMTLRGVAWYQGEANTFLHTDQYNCTFPALIADWRRAFHAGSVGQTELLLPFGFVQLSTYRQQSPADSFARLRWHQTADLGVVPNAKMPGTFMAVAMDLGDERSPYGSIHPRDKQNVAHRLQLGARAVAYGEKNVIFQGPYPTRAVLEVTRGLLNVTYSQELVWRRRDTRAFEVCCSSPPSPCGWLPAPVVAVESRRVTLALAGCGGLVLALRYAWAEWPCDYQSCVLYNSWGLPAPPFLLDALAAGETPGRSQPAGGREMLLLPGSRFSPGI
ncbi:unnamed protein product [Bubo scandiacus]